MDLEHGLVGHWPFAGDCRDHSRIQHDSSSYHVVTAAAGPGGAPNTAAVFDGARSHIRVGDHPSLNFGTGDFSIAVWVHTEKAMDDVIGDIVSKFDGPKRRGFNFNIVSHPGVVRSHSNDRNIHFGIDDCKIDAGWTDCGRPGKAVHIAGIAVFEGRLYASTFEPAEGECGHVYRYESGSEWTDCGSPAPCNSVSCLAVHDGALYCGVRHDTGRGHCLPISPNTHPGGKVFRYERETDWVECGHFDYEESTKYGGGITCLVSFRGTLYAVAGRDRDGVLAYRGGTQWERVGPYARMMCLGFWNGRLYGLTSGADAVYCMQEHGRWADCGTPSQTGQLYSFAVFHGRPHIGTWPHAEVFRHDGQTTWTSVGRPGYSLETMGMAVYNGMLYAGVLPMAQVYRYDGTGWQLTGNVDNTPNVMLRRAWTMAVYDGKLYCGALPSGHVLSLEAGKLASYDHPLPPLWHHIGAVREDGLLKIVLDGQRVAASSSFDPTDFDMSNDKPLEIGFGAHDYFNGRMSDLRIYNRALSAQELDACSRSKRRN